MRKTRLPASRKRDLALLVPLDTPFATASPPWLMALAVPFTALPARSTVPETVPVTASVTASATTSPPLATAPPPLATKSPAVEAASVTVEAMVLAALTVFSTAVSAMVPAMSLS